MTPNTPTPAATAPAGQVHTATPADIARLAGSYARRHKNARAKNGAFRVQAEDLAIGFAAGYRAALKLVTP